MLALNSIREFRTAPAPHDLLTPGRRGRSRPPCSRTCSCWAAGITTELQRTARITRSYELRLTPEGHAARSTPKRRSPDLRPLRGQRGEVWSGVERVAPVLATSVTAEIGDGTVGRGGTDSSVEALALGMEFRRPGPVSAHRGRDAPGPARCLRRFADVAEPRSAWSIREARGATAASPAHRGHGDAGRRHSVSGTRASSPSRPAATSRSSCGSTTCRRCRRRRIRCHLR